MMHTVLLGSNISAHHLASGAPVPEWLHLLPPGKFSGADGRGPYTVPNAAALIAASMASGSLPIDENHATDLAAPKGAPSPARGWIVEMQQRPDGIWARVVWTETGRALLADKAYRHISPVIAHDKSGAVSRILRAALTNATNLTQLTALNTSGARDGSKEINPTAIEREIARRTGLDPARLAQMRAEREQKLTGLNAAGTKHLAQGTLQMVAQRTFDQIVHTPPDTKGPDISASEREIARRMGIDVNQLAAMRRQREAANRGLADYDRQKVGGFESAITGSNKLVAQT